MTCTASRYPLRIRSISEFWSCSGVLMPMPRILPSFWSLRRVSSATGLLVPGPRPRVELEEVERVRFQIP